VKLKDYGLDVITEIKFSYGHRVLDYHSECSTCHGHDAVLQIRSKIRKNEPDIKNIIEDFNKFESDIINWVKSNFDHNFIVSEKDDITIQFLKSVPRKKEPFITTFSPTVPNIGNYLAKHIIPKFSKSECFKVVELTIKNTNDAPLTFNVS
jgi:6-pyruvoyltetrahydropterin/6-carboxytetrahydropterin synthase